MLTLRDQLLNLAFDLRLAGWSAGDVAVVYQAADRIPGDSARSRATLANTSHHDPARC